MITITTRTCHGQKSGGNKKTGEEIKALKLIGCSYFKALTLNLLYKLLPILTLLDRRSSYQQVCKPGKKCIGAAATRPVKL